MTKTGGHPDPVVEAVSLVALHHLLKRSLVIADALGDTFLGALIDTAVQETAAKIKNAESGE